MKRRILTRLAKTMHYYATQETPAERNERYRATGITIGERTVIYDSVLDPIHPHLLTIGADCTITGATLLCHDDSPVLFLNRQRAAPVTIGDRVFIGRNAVVLPGVRIGSDVVIGVGAIVTKDVPPGTVSAGNPASVISTLDDYLSRLRNSPDLLEVHVPTNLVEDPELLSHLRRASVR